MKNMTIKKKQSQEELIVLELEDQEDAEDLSWMIQEDQDTVIKTDNKKRKHKGGSGLGTVPPRGNASRRFWVWRGRSEHAVGSLSSCI